VEGVWKYIANGLFPYSISMSLQGRRNLEMLTIRAVYTSCSLVAVCQMCDDAIQSLRTHGVSSTRYSVGYKATDPSVM